jgi:hypothetical protein
MSLYLNEWEKATSARLIPVRNNLSSAGVPVRMLPLDAGKYGDRDKYGDIVIAFPQSTASPRETSAGVQEVQEIIIIQISLPRRYSDKPENKANIDWCVNEIIALLTNYSLPHTTKKIQYESRKLYPPEAGRWVTELTFSFETLVVPRDDVLAMPVVVQTEVNIT